MALDNYGGSAWESNQQKHQNYSIITKMYTMISLVHAPDLDHFPLF